MRITNNNLQVQLEKFWVLEERPKVNNYSNEETACEEHFKKHVKRTQDGGFEVALHFKITSLQLEDSNQVLRRFKYLEKRLVSNDAFRNKYVKFMSKYEKL